MHEPVSQCEKAESQHKFLSRSSPMSNNKLPISHRDDALTPQVFHQFSADGCSLRAKHRWSEDEPGEDA